MQSLRKWSGQRPVCSKHPYTFKGPRVDRERRPDLRCGLTHNPSKARLGLKPAGETLLPCWYPLSSHEPGFWKTWVKDSYSEIGHQPRPLGGTGPNPHPLTERDSENEDRHSNIKVGSFASNRSHGPNSLALCQVFLCAELK